MIVNRLDFCNRCAGTVVVDRLQASPDRNGRSQKGICPDCRANKTPCAIPIVRRGDWELYDTRKVFAGLRVWKVRQGDGVEYQEEARSPHGCFYAAGEACVAFETKPGKTLLANILLREFPEARRFVSGDDGVNVLHVPVSVFPAFAKRVGAYRKRVLSERQRAVLEAAREHSPIGRKGGTPV